MVTLDLTRYNSPIPSSRFLAFPYDYTHTAPTSRITTTLIPIKPCERERPCLPRVLFENAVYLSWMELPVSLPYHYKPFQPCVLGTNFVPCHSRHAVHRQCIWRPFPLRTSCTSRFAPLLILRLPPFDVVTTDPHRVDPYLYR